MNGTELVLTHYLVHFRNWARGIVTAREVACELVYQMAVRGEAALLPIVAELAPDEIWQEAQAYLREQAAEGFNFVVLGAGSGPRTEEELERVRAAQRNGFRAVAKTAGIEPPEAVIDPAWRTSTVVSLARQMYESRDFSAMPILADALQDAGCDNAALLDHCRGSGPHVRGCWVAALLLDRG